MNTTQGGETQKLTAGPKKLFRERLSECEQEAQLTTDGEISVGEF